MFGLTRETAELALYVGLGLSGLCVVSLLVRRLIGGKISLEGESFISLLVWAQIFTFVVMLPVFWLAGGVEFDAVTWLVVVITGFIAGSIIFIKPRDQSEETRFANGRAMVALFLSTSTAFGALAWLTVKTNSILPALIAVLIWSVTGRILHAFWKGAKEGVGVEPAKEKVS